MNGLIAMLVPLALSLAPAPEDIYLERTCFNPYGEGYSWLLVKVSRLVHAPPEHCLRCRRGVESVASLSVPYGPRGTYITQRYLHEAEVLEPWSRTFERIGDPTGPTAQEWEDWFPGSVEVLLDREEVPLAIRFKGELLPLHCD